MRRTKSNSQPGAGLSNSWLTGGAQNEIATLAVGAAGVGTGGAGGAGQRAGQAGPPEAGALGAALASPAEGHGGVGGFRPEGNQRPGDLFRIPLPAAGEGLRPL